MKKLITFLFAFFVVAEVSAQCSVTISPAAPSTCSGVGIVLTASAANQYTWSANAGGANTGTVSVAPTANTTYTVTAMTGTCTATAMVTVSVYPLPTVTVNQPTLCANSSATLTAGGAVTYTWSTGAVMPTVLVSPTVTTTYTVVGEDANGCMNFTVSTVTVSPSPTISVNSDAICSGSTTLTAVTSGTSYTWSTNAGSANTASVQVVPASTTVYTVWASNPPNTCTAQATSTVYVNSSSVTITPPGGTYCTDNPYQFTGSANPGNILSWQWYVTPSANVNVQGAFQSGATMTFYQTGNYTLTCIANNQTGCRDSFMLPVSVAQTPTVNVTNIAPIICLGGSGTTLFSTVTPNFGPTTYTWSGTGITTVFGSGDSASVNPSTAGIYTYTLQGTQNGCVSQPTTITATVNPAPTPTIIVNNDSICSGTGTTFTVVGLPSNATYTWSAPVTGGLGTSGPGNASWATPVFSAPYDTAFTYYLDCYVPGCPTYTTSNFPITVLATPIVQPVSDTVDNCNKMGDSLEVTSIPPVSAGVTFTWTPSTGLSATTGSTVFANPINPTWYYVTPFYHGCPGIRDSIRMLIGDTTVSMMDAQYLIVCKNARDTLFAFPSLGQLNTSYQYYWEPSIGPNAVTPLNNGDTAIINPIATQIYTLTVTGICVRQPKTEMTIYVNQCPNIILADFTMNTDTICVNHCIYFTDLTHNNNSLPLFYTWIFYGGIPVGQVGGYTVLTDTAYYQQTDSTLIPPVKVCYKINSSLNPGGVFPVVEMISHGPPGSGMPVVTVTHNVKVDAGPLSNAGTNITINLGDSTQLNGTLSTGNFAISQYVWSPPDSLHCDTPPWPNEYSCPRPWANPSETTTYYLTVKDKNGCVSTDSMTVYVDLKCYDPFVPSAFSPNGDGKNDILYVRSNCLQNFVFKVFDRWGEMVFESTTLNFGWDGSFRGVPVNAGVFVWTLEGFLSNGKEVKKHGSTTILK